MQRQFSPHHIVISLSAALTLVTIYAVWLATSTPWLGIELIPDKAGIKIVKVSKNSPAELAGIRQGTFLQQISLTDGQYIDLNTQDVMIEPDDLALYKDYLDFFARQTIIHNYLLNKNLSLFTSDGHYAVKPLNSKPISQLSFYFWFQLFCAYSIVVMGVLVWIYSQREMASRLYALATIGLLIAIVPSAIYTTRELALDGEIFYWLSRTNQIGVMLFAGPGTALFWFYPKPIHRFPVLYVIVFLIVSFLVLNFTQVYQSLDYAVRLPVVFWLTLDIILGTVQWVRSKSDPVSRAQLKWFIVAWTSGPIAYVSLNVFPLLIGFEPVITQKTGWALFVLVYLGMALGLRRYRLFNLDRWILNAWFWLLCGAGIIMFDAFLFTNLGINHEQSIIISLALIGWAYFPLRQYIFDRLAKKNMSYNSRELMPELLSVLLTRSQLEKPGVLWPKLLDQMYKPLHLEIAKNTKSFRAAIENDGQSILTPKLPGSDAIRLYHANKGARLFSPDDTRMIDAISLIYKHIIDFQDAQLQGAKKERKRLARDLHDDISSKVLSLIYRSGSEENADLGRDILGELRNVINDLENDDLSLSENLYEWESEARQRCDNMGIDLDWNQLNIHATLQISTAEKSNIRKIIRESLSNIIKHADATAVKIEISYNARHLHIIISDDGNGFELANAKKGRGLLNIERRAREMSAHIDFLSSIDKGTVIHMQLPIFTELPQVAN